jgi:hypothetical protein
MNLKEQIEFMRELEAIASDALETGVPVAGWTGEDTLKVSKIRKQLETILKGGRPRQWNSMKEKNSFYNAKRRSKQKTIA